MDITERIGALLGGAPDGSCHVFLQRPGAGRPEGPRRREIELRLPAEA